MSQLCQARPLSWLVLEGYQLGSLPPPEAEAVRAHLAACPVCEGCLDRIRQDRRPLPPLPVCARAVPRSLRPALALRWALATGFGLLLAGLAVWWGIERKTDSERGWVPVRSMAYKGGELALSLVRERQGALQNDPTTFAPGDRFKVLVTCPPGEPLYGDVLVFADGQVWWPLTQSDLVPQPLPCGNRVALPKAFSVDSHNPVVVCLVLPDGSVCLVLRPISRG